MLVLSPSDLVAEIVDATDGLQAVRFDPSDPVPPPAGTDAEVVITMTEHAPAIRELFGQLGA